ncbi:MAG: hypothetical protein Q9227_008602 [Pyrenula ochraceoflavens]
MAPRNARKARDNDYSNLGKAGRRTGVVLPEGKRDQDGLEEITGLFSSPQKPSTAKSNRTAGTSGNEESTNDNIEGSEDMVWVDSSGQGPTQVLSTRKSLRGPSFPPPRSASPRKTGINGVARRSGVGLEFTPSKAPPLDEDRENTPSEVNTTIRPNGIVRRFNPESSPLKERTSVNGTPRSTRQMQARAATQSSPMGQMQRVVDEILDNKNEPLEDGLPNGEASNQQIASPSFEADDVNPMGYDDNEEDQDYQLPELRGSPVVLEDGIDRVRSEHSGSTIQVEPPQQSAQHKRKVGRPGKRKSDTLLEASAADDKPKTKRAKTSPSSKAKGKQPVYRDPSPIIQSIERTPRPTKTNKPNQKSKRVPKPKDPNIPIRRTQFSPDREKEIEEVAERIKSRPGGPRSLYIFRRETPMDDSTTRTRSGRISVKPVAYWKNERCVYGEDNGAQSLKPGERFPMSSIKEVVRVEEQDGEGGGRRGGRKRKGKGSKNAASADAVSSDEEEEDEDAQAEEWENEIGVFTGVVRQWDQEAQEGTEEPLETGQFDSVSLLESFPRIKA